MKNVAPLLIALAAGAASLVGAGCANRGMKVGDGGRVDRVSEPPAEVATEAGGEAAPDDGGGATDGLDGGSGGDGQGERPPMTCPARFNFENGNLQGASINPVWKGITAIAARDVADGAKTFCGYGSLEITAAFSHVDAGADAGTGDPYVTGEVIIPLNSGMTAENLTGKTITVHVQAVPPDTQNDLAFYALLITSTTGYQTLPGYPIKPINTNQFASKSTALAGADAGADAGIAGMNMVTRLSLELFSYRSYTGKIYVDEIDIR
jgi:hypothetical protein